MSKIDRIEQEVHLIKERLVEKIPGHFDMRHVVAAFFGALFFGFTFVLKGLLLQVGLSLSMFHLIIISLTTWLILTAEIYFIGYARIPLNQRKQRTFGQFWAKRIITYYLIALFVSYLLLFVYGLTNIAQDAYHVLKLTIAISLPAAIGAAISDLLGKY
jgi:uncharacterized membrane protein